MKAIAVAALFALLCAFLISRAATAGAGGHVALQTSQATSTPLVPSPFDIEKMSLEEAVGAMSAMTREEAVHVFNEMSTGKVVAMMGKMDLAEVSEIWGDMEPVKAGAVMEDVPVETAGKIVGLVPEVKLVARLPEMSATKLWELPVELLLDRLPSVDAMHLDFWERPSVATDLAQPVVSQPTEDRTVYLLPETRRSEWALVVGSPAPFDRIWAKFTRPLESVRFVVDTFGLKQPADTSDLLLGRIANSFFRIEIDGAGPQDIDAAVAIAFVDKSWLEENDIHKWSIEFNRFDNGLNTWVPSPSKRIRENEDRLFFAVALPGFSTFAITGARELPARVFEVRELRIGPAPRAGEAVDISADVTNTSSQVAVYPAVLWIDNSIEAAKSVTVGPGQTAAVSFAVTRPQGTHSVRLDRQLGEFTVRSLDPHLPAAGGLAPTPGLLAILGAAGLLLILGGGYVSRMRRP